MPPCAKPFAHGKTDGLHVDNAKMLIVFLAARIGWGALGFYRFQRLFQEEALGGPMSSFSLSAQGSGQY